MQMGRKDFLAGKKRRSNGSAAMRGARIHRTWARRSRVRNLRNAIGHRAGRVVTTGLLPAATFGAAVNGLDDREVKRLRQLSATVMKPGGRLRSLKTTLLLNGAPTLRYELAPVNMYARMVWRAGVDRDMTGQERLGLPDIGDVGRLLKSTPGIWSWSARGGTRGRSGGQRETRPLRALAR